jgi:hypothetical protein
VHFFLFRYVAGATSDHDDEVDDARWVPIDEARRTMAYRGERDVLERALAWLDRET